MAYGPIESSPDEASSALGVMALPEGSVGFSIRRPLWGIRLCLSRSLCQLHWMIWALCVRRSSNAAVMVGSPKTCVQSADPRFAVMITDPFSWRSARTWNSSSDPSVENGMVPSSFHGVDDGLRSPAPWPYGSCRCCLVQGKVVLF